MKMKTTIPLMAFSLFLGMSMQSKSQQLVLDESSIKSYFDGFRSSNQQDLSKLPKMDRDIVILQNVLNDLFKGSREGVFYSSRGAKGMYISGKGVFFNLNHGTSPEVLFVDLDVKTDDDKVIEKDEKELVKEKEDAIKSLSQDFLVNYGSILSELKDNEQVILNVNYPDASGTKIQRSRDGNIAYLASANGRGNSKRMVSSITAKDLKDFLSGKLSMEAATAKITSKVSADGDIEANDTKIMAGILDDVFQSTFDGTFRKSGRTSWTYFEGFGLMFDMNFSSDIRQLRTSISTENGIKSLSEKELQEKLMADELKFEGLMNLAKESLVTYGRTLRSVKSDEVIILNMYFDSAFRKINNFPAAIRIQVNKSQIEAFSKGSISLEQLKQEIDIKRLSSSTNNSEVHYFPASPSEVFDVAPARVTGRVKGQN